jgi:hypothetical protein
VGKALLDSRPQTGGNITQYKGLAFGKEAVRLNALGERSTPHRHTFLPLPLWGEVTGRNPLTLRRAKNSEGAQGLSVQYWTLWIALQIESAASVSSPLDPNTIHNPTELLQWDPHPSSG